MFDQENSEKTTILICIEGVDGSGKSSVIEAIRSKLDTKKSNVIFIAEPRYSGFSKELWNLLDKKKDDTDTNTSFFSMLAMRASNFKKLSSKIAALGDSYSAVVSDRGSLSTYVYQVKGDLEKEEILMLSEKMLNTQPDLTFYLEVSPEVALQRLQDRKDQKDFYDPKSVEEIEGKISLYKHYFYTQKKLITIPDDRDVDAKADVILREINTF